MADWLRMTACDLGRGIGAGEIDPIDLCEAYLTAINAHEFTDRIYARLTQDRARAEAAAASERAKKGVRRGLLDGVPISWKDLYDTAGVVTEAGTALLKGRVPDTDAEVLANATRAGLVCLGKTHMTELAFSGLGLNTVTETPPNSTNPALVAGGSSSGAATSVAFGLAAAGIGSDTGGSVRIPSAWNDLVGLKTTHGLLSTAGVVPLCESFDTVGPLCRSVEDAAELLAVMAGETAPDLSGATLAGKRFMVLETVALQNCRVEPLAAFEKAVERLEAAGAEVVRGEIPVVERAMELAGCLFTSEAYAQWHTEIEADPDAMFPPVRERFRAGAEYSAVQFIESWQELRQLRMEYQKATAGFDAVLVPSSPILPPNIERLLTDHNYFNSENLLALQNTRIGNLMGLCGLTLPTETPTCGITALCDPFTEAKLLRLGAAMESVVKG
ncbi:amidase [Rhodobacterales bacterium 52_120_T64]|nr:amidase [Rhodobacterales bacterium 52_120_T64]